MCTYMKIVYFFRLSLYSAASKRQCTENGENRETDRQTGGLHLLLYRRSAPRAWEIVRANSEAHLCRVGDQYSRHASSARVHRQTADDFDDCSEDERAEVFVQQVGTAVDDENDISALATHRG